MDDNNLVQFPTFIIEKKRELARMEHDLALSRVELEMDKVTVRRQKLHMGLQVMIAFSVGMILSFLMFLAVG